MTFDEYTNYYPTLTEAMKDSRRKMLYESKEKLLESLETSLFDHYNVDELYIVNEFFDRDIFSIDRIPIYFKMKVNLFEQFVDNHEANKLCNNFDIYIEANNSIFRFKNGSWGMRGNKIIKKEKWKK